MARKKLDFVEFADNPEPRCAVVLLLDTSRSMEGDAIKELNKGLIALDKAIKADELANLRIELAVMTFGGAVQAIDIRGGGDYAVPLDAQKVFVTADLFFPPELRANGDTPMGEAVQKAMSLLNERKDVYKQHGVDYFRPWIFLITDGKPNDEDWEQAAEKIREEQARKALIFYAVGVKGADMETLAQFTLEEKPMHLQGLAFSELFQWLSKSLMTVVQSRPGEPTTLPAAEGWVMETPNE